MRRSARPRLATIAAACLLAGCFGSDQSPVSSPADVRYAFVLLGENEVGWCDAVPPWTMGIRAFWRNIDGRTHRRSGE